ncbi:MAG: ferrous iron transport protein B [Planctomycetales bacterium]|nr:ferrous iron transport protein B [Planctomycetales bacterium]
MPPRPARTIALIGNPNTGKSTLFNSLTGMRARVGNYPGVTVEKKVGRVRWDDVELELVDLPGTYSLAPRSLDEQVTLDVMLGRQGDIGEVDAVLCVVDASNLERNLYLVSQVLSLGVPVVLALNMSDVARDRGIEIDDALLGKRLGVEVVRTEGHRRRGLDALQAAMLRTAARSSPSPSPNVFPDAFQAATKEARQWVAKDVPAGLVERMVIDTGGVLEQTLLDDEGRRNLSSLRQRLAEQSCAVPAMEARSRYGWIRKLLDGVIQRPLEKVVTATDRIDRVLTHRFLGIAVFVLVMAMVFQAIGAWATPLMDLVEAGQGWVSELVSGWIAPGPLRSLLVDGVIAGVGGVLVFTPQIAFLFFFIAVLEDCGYMARAAFLMDRVMTRVGLSGKSFVPLMSSFACAIPGIMATRVIENRRDRMVTILIAPLMSCSARLPVYVLLIYTFIPGDVAWLGGWLSLRTLVLLAMMFVGLVVAAPVAWLLKRFVFPGEAAPLVMELPDYKLPTPRLVLHRAFDRALAFVTRAGSLIFATTILVWAAGYFPGDHQAEHDLERRLEAAEATDTATAATTTISAASAASTASAALAAGDSAATDSRASAAIDAGDPESMLAELRRLRAERLRDSALGRLGQAVEPVVRPLGWDWRIGVGAIASFPAREVIIATLGTIYSLGGDVDEEDTGLKQAMRNAKWPDGRPVYNVPVALSILVFFALCAQCGATLMIIWRETNHWGWPIFTFCYMTTLAYFGALVVYQIGSAWWG